MFETHLKIYKLLEDKKLSDLTVISPCDEIELIKTEGDFCFFSHQSDGVITLFWSRKSDVEFVRDFTVFLSGEELNKRNKYINGEFL